MYPSRHALYVDIDDAHALIASSLTGAVDLLDAEGKADWRALAEGRAGGVDGGLVAALKERGYLFEAAEEEVRLFQELAATFNSPRPNQPLRFAVCPTYQCNLACRYCYEGELPQSSDLTLGEQDVDRLFEAIDYLYAARGGHKASVELTGGEPLLPKNKALVQRLFAESASRGFSIGIVSNGVCLSSHFADIFLEHSRSLSFVQVTLDGPASIHNARRPFRGGQGTFERIVDSVDFLLAQQVPVRLRVNIDPANIGSLIDLAHFMEEKGWPRNSSFGCLLAPVLDHRGDSRYPYLVPEHELSRAVTDLFSRQPQLRDLFQYQFLRVIQHITSVMGTGKGWPGPCFKYCEANSPSFLVFGAEGLIYPCGEAIANPELAIGRFLPAYEMWPEREALWRDRSIASIPACRNCSVAGFCGGGCTFAAIVQTGSPHAGMCGHSREVLHDYCRFLGQSLLSPIPGNKPKP